MKKRFLSCFMALALCLTLLPTAAFAEGVEGEKATHENIVKAVKCTAHEDTDGNKMYDYCNADSEADAVATLTVDGNTGNTYYTDLPSALEAASSKGGTVTLQKDVENVSQMLVIEGSFHVTLDLNGKKITGDGSSSTLLGISNLSDVTICDSSESKAGQIKCTASGYAVYVSAGCNLTIAGGTFEGTDNATTNAPGYAVGVDRAKLIITGGTFNSPIDAKDKLIVSGGTFNGAVTINASGATITGGTFNGAFSMSAQPDVFSGGTFKQQAVFSSVSNILTGGTFENGIKSTDKRLYELLAENKAYQTADDWLDVDTTYFYNGIGSSVTVAEAPIHSVTLTVNGTSVELDEDNKGRFSVELGTDVTLTASCEGSMEASYGTWYPTHGGTEDGGTAWPVQQGTGKSLSYTLPAEDLTIGTHTYRVSFCSENPGSSGQVTGYYKVAQITITVEKINLANATVTINPWPTDGKVRFSPFYRPAASVLAILFGDVENKITVTANGKKDTLSNDDYTYEGATATQVGKYTLTITATNSCANYTGSKTFDWEVTPCRLYNPSYLGNQKYTKIYDGTTNLPESYHYYAYFSYKDDDEVRNVDWSKDESESNYEVTAAEFVSPDAGENKPINQTITLKNENFVFAPTEIIKIKGITTAGRTMTYTNFTPTEAYPSVGTTFNIEKATVPKFDNAVTLTVINDLADTYTVDLDALLPNLESPKTYGKIGYSQPAVQLDTGYYTVGAGNAKVENGKLILTIDKNPVTTTGSIGTVTVTVSSTNYRDFTLTIKVNAANKPVSSGGGSSSGSSSKTTYPVNTPTADNGTAAVSPKNAAKGDTVTITVTPDSGYKVGKVTVTDANGNTISVADKGNGKYTFTMPTGKVTITPTFVKIAEQPTEKAFVDVAKSDWFADAVAYVTGKGLMNGTGSDTFSPNASTTRGMLMTVLARYAGEDTTGGATWYEKGMNWAKAKGVSDGTNPTVNITREQLVTMLYRYAGSPKANGSLDSFSDAASVSNYAANAMQWAVANGIVNGSNGKLNPQNNATRAQVAAILMRFCEMSK